MLHRLITRHNDTSKFLFHKSRKEKHFHRYVNCQNKHLGTSSLVDLDIRENGVIVVSLNRPEARNALNTNLAIELNKVLEGIKDKSIKPKGNSSVKALVLTGHGKAFCAGADFGALGCLQTPLLGEIKGEILQQNPGQTKNRTMRRKKF